MEDQFQEIIGSNFYTEEDKSAGEFELGLGIAALMDCFENPDLYDEPTVAGIFEHIENCLAGWRQKYNKEILELHEGS